MGHLVACLAVVPLGAHCGAPFQTDDPSVIAPGRVELLLFYQSTLEASARNGALPGLESHFGVFDDAELDVTTPYAFSTPVAGGTRRGYGGTIIGVKYRLVAESERTHLISLVPKFVAPTGSSAHGLGNGGSQIFLAAAAQMSRDRFQTYGNAGYWINNGAGNRNYWFAGWQMQYRFSDRVAIGAEIFYTGAQAIGESSSTGFNLGGTYTFASRQQLLFSAGRGIQNASATNRVSAYAGYQIGF